MQKPKDNKQKELSPNHVKHLRNMLGSFRSTGAPSHPLMVPPPDEAGQQGQVSQPTGGDDQLIPAKTGEYVIPEPVVKRKGTQFFDNLIKKTLEEVMPPDQAAKGGEGTQGSGFQWGGEIPPPADTGDTYFNHYLNYHNLHKQLADESNKIIDSAPTDSSGNSDAESLIADLKKQMYLQNPIMDAMKHRYRTNPRWLNAMTNQPFSPYIATPKNAGTGNAQDGYWRGGEVGGHNEYANFRSQGASGMHGISNTQGSEPWSEPTPLPSPSPNPFGNPDPNVFVNHEPAWAAAGYSPRDGGLAMYNNPWFGRYGGINTPNTSYNAPSWTPGSSQGPTQIPTYFDHAGYPFAVPVFPATADSMSSGPQPHTPHKEDS